MNAWARTGFALPHSLLANTCRATRRAMRLMLAFVLVVGEIVWIPNRDGHPGSAWWSVVIALLALHTWLVHLEARDPLLPPRAVLGGTIAAALAAVLARPVGSHDVYQYAMYGRMVAHYHANPYVQVPAAFPHDGLYPSLSAVWHHTPSVYGPLFTGLSALGAHLYGSSAAAAARFFQSVAALALVGSVVYLMKQKASTAALVFVGLSPLLLVTVNGAHNDLLAGALLLIGLNQARRNRPGRSAVLVAAACLVKAVAAPAALGVVVAYGIGRRWRDVAKFSATLAGSIAAGYVAVGGFVALAPLRGLDKHSSSSSFWDWVHPEQLVPHARHPNPLGTGLATVVLVVVIVGVLVAHVWRGTLDAPVLALTLMACSIFAAAYVMPWYPAALLPAGALMMVSPVRRLIQLGSAALLVAYVMPTKVPVPRWLPTMTIHHVCGAILGVVVAWLLLDALGRRQMPRI